MNEIIFQQIKKHWDQLREMTYDLLDVIDDSDLKKTLPFYESSTMENQFYCMTGTQESWKSKFEMGMLNGWKCSLDNEKEVTIDIIKEHMREADIRLEDLLQKADLLQKLPDGTTPMYQYMQLVEHESLHQGQLVNFIYCHHLKVPESWNKWGLK